MAKTPTARTRSADSKSAAVKNCTDTVRGREGAPKRTRQASPGTSKPASQPRARSQSKGDAVGIAEKLLAKCAAETHAVTEQPARRARGRAQQQACHSTAAEKVVTPVVGEQPITKRSRATSSDVPRARSQPVAPGRAAAAAARDAVSAQPPAKRLRAADQDKQPAKVPRARSQSSGPSTAKAKTGVAASGPGAPAEATRAHGVRATQEQLRGSAASKHSQDIIEAIRGRQMSRPSMEQAPGSPPNLPFGSVAVGARRRSSSGGAAGGRRRSSSGGSAAVSVVAGTVAACLGAAVV